MDKVEPQKEHRWLERLVGEWAIESEMLGPPGQPPMHSTGTEVVRSVGGLWVVCEGRAEMPGIGTGTMILTLGFDPARGRFVGTFLGSMMTHLWIYDGTLDAAEKVLTLDTEGPNFTTPGKMGKYQDAIEWLDDGRRLLTSQFQAPDGTWHRFMTATYRRTK